MSSFYADLSPKERTALKINYVLTINRAPKLSSTARRVATVLTLNYVHNSDTSHLCGYAWPSQATLAAELGCGLRTIQNAMNELEASGWLFRCRRRHYYYQPNWNHPLLRAKKPAPLDTQEVAHSNAQKSAPLGHGKNWDVQIPSLEGVENRVSKARKPAPNNLEQNVEKITERTRVVALASPPEGGSRGGARIGAQGDMGCIDGIHDSRTNPTADTKEDESNTASPVFDTPRPAVRPVKEEVQLPAERQLVRRMIELELVDDEDAGWLKLNDMERKEVHKLVRANLAGQLSPATLAEVLGMELRTAE